MSLVARLRALDTGAVSDALDRLSLRGTVHGLHALSGRGRIGGRVVTVRLVAGEPSQAGPHLGTSAIEAAEPGDIVVVEHRQRDDCAGWGGILSTAAKTRGLSGTIVDGLARDIDESRDEDYPVFARGAVPTTARGRVHEQAFNVEVSIGGVPVRPGDYAIADASGVVFVSSDSIERVLEAAESIAAKERAMAKAVREGRRVSQVMGGDYETMLEGNEHE